MVHKSTVSHHSIPVLWDGGGGQRKQLNGIKHNKTLSGIITMALLCIDKFHCNSTYCNLLLFLCNKVAMIGIFEQKYFTQTEI